MLTSSEQTPSLLRKEFILDTLEAIHQKVLRAENLSKQTRNSLVRHYTIILSALQNPNAGQHYQEIRDAMNEFELRVAKEVSLHSPQKEVEKPSMKERLEESIYQYVISWLQNWIKTEYDLHFHEEFQRNSEEKPYDEILGEGLRLFSERNPDVPLVWNPKRAVSGGGAQLGRQISYVANYIPTGMGASLYQNKDLAIGWKENDWNVEKVREFKMLKYAIEKERNKIEYPVSTSFVFSAVLEIKGGNIGEALLLMAEFFKFISRLLPDYAWIETNLKNESSYISPDKIQSIPGGNMKYRNKYLGVDMDYMDMNAQNQHGMHYHLAHITSLLDRVMPEDIAQWVMLEYLPHGAGHGVNKALADVMLLSRLRKIERLFRPYLV